MASTTTSPDGERSPPAAWPRGPLGRTGLEVTRLAWGTAALGDMPAAFGFESPESDANETIRAMFASPVNLIDTSANYGDGAAERRLGMVLTALGGPPRGTVIATKADRESGTNDFSADQMRRSVDASRRRLGMASLPLVHLHDPEHGDFAAISGPGGALEALLRLRDDGVIGHLGLAGGPVGLMERYLDLGLFDVLVTHNRWTLLDRSAGRLIDRAAELGVAVLNAAPFGSGLLTGAPGRTRYGYREAEPAFRTRAEAMAATCRRHGVDLAAAALAFSMRDARITSTIVGLTKPERVEQLLALAATPIPDALWPELDRFALPPNDGRADRW